MVVDRTLYIVDSPPQWIGFVVSRDVNVDRRLRIVDRPQITVDRDASSADNKNLNHSFHSHQLLQEKRLCHIKNSCRHGRSFHLMKPLLLYVTDPSGERGAERGQRLCMSSPIRYRTMQVL